MRGRGVILSSHFLKIFFIQQSIPRGGSRGKPTLMHRRACGESLWARRWARSCGKSTMYVLFPYIYWGGELANPKKGEALKCRQRNERKRVCGGDMLDRRRDSRLHLSFSLSLFLLTPFFSTLFRYKGQLGDFRQPHSFPSPPPLLLPLLLLHFMRFFFFFFYIYTNE